MKNIIFTVIISLFVTSCSNQKEYAVNHGFIKNNIETLSDNRKTLIVEFWDPSCAPCLKLKEDIFENENNTEFIETNFVLVQVSSSDSIYRPLFKYYNLQFQSTILFFDKNGNEIDRSVGYNGNNESYLNFLKNIAESKNLYHTIYSGYLKDSTDINLNYLLAKKYLFRYENEKAVKLFKYILLNDSTDNYGFNAECNFRIAENDFLNTGNIKNLKSFVNYYSNNNFSPQAYIYLINYYKKKNDHRNCVITSGEALSKFPNNPDILNKHAWNIYLFKIKEDYNDALEMMQKAIQINPDDARYWDTQAWLYFEIGKTEKAIQSENKAIELFSHPAYKEALKKFEATNNKNT